MKYLLMILTTAMISCTAPSIQLSDLSCFECVAYDHDGNLTTTDTIRLQRFLISGWCERLEDWDLTCDCWQVECNY